jgi:hypothetical protein
MLVQTETPPTTMMKSEKAALMATMMGTADSGIADSFEEPNFIETGPHGLD